MQIKHTILDQGKGVPLVLLHSSMSSKAQWRKLTEALKSTYRIIAIDLFGYGNGDYPANPETFTLIQEVTRVASMIDECLGCQSFHLIGHSYGGATALRYSYEHPARIISLGLYEPVAFHLLEANEPAQQMINRVSDQIVNDLAEGRQSAAAEHFIDFWSGTGTYAALKSDTQQTLDRFIHKVALDFQALRHESLRATDYQRIISPICLLHSPESPLPTRRVAEVLQQALPQLESHWVDGGHMAPITHAEQVNPYWIDFLTRQNAERH